MFVLFGCLAPVHGTPVDVASLESGAGLAYQWFLNMANVGNGAQRA